MDKNPLKTMSKKACVVFKKSRLEFVKEQGTKAEQAELPSLLPAHERHLEAIEQVKNTLGEKNIDFISIGRSELSDELLKDRLVITVGGDGTLLDASHHCLNSPIIGVNSDTKLSVGALCAADKDNFSAILEEILSGKIKPRPIARLSISMDEKVVSPLALNDILICNKNPAAMTRFWISKDKKTEHHRSSGLWVATAAGSTGGIFSSGGKPIDFYAQQGIFRVREPYASDTKKPELLFGSFVDEKLLVKSDMGEGKLFIDGPHRSIDIDFGQTVEISLSKHPLWLFDGPNIDKKRNEIIQYRQMIKNYS